MTTETRIKPGELIASATVLIADILNNLEKKAGIRATKLGVTWDGKQCEVVISEMIIDTTVYGVDK